MFRVCFAFLTSAVVVFATSPEYIVNWENRDVPRMLIRDWVGKGDYLSPVFTSHIDKNQVKLILEVGSRDVIDALELSDYYKAHVYAFECNPEAIQICNYNLGNNPNITLVPLAAWNETKSLTFFPVIPGGQVVSLGSSSLFEFDPNGPVMGTQRQGEITVQGVRLDEWIREQELENVDLICIDAQGATLQIAQGLEKFLPKVKYIIAEAEIRSYYIGEALYPEIEAYLNSQGFSAVTQMNHEGLYADVLFVRNDLIRR